MRVYFEFFFFSFSFLFFFNQFVNKYQNNNRNSTIDDQKHLTKIKTNDFRSLSHFYFKFSFFMFLFISILKSKVYFSTNIFIFFIPPISFENNKNNKIKIDIQDQTTI